MKVKSSVLCFCLRQIELLKTDAADRELVKRALWSREMRTRQTRSGEIHAPGNDNLADMRLDHEDGDGNVATTTIRYALYRKVSETREREEEIVGSV